jgi:hypothetical protein
VGISAQHDAAEHSVVTSSVVFQCSASRHKSSIGTLSAPALLSSWLTCRVSFTRHLSAAGVVHSHGESQRAVAHQRSAASAQLVRALVRAQFQRVSLRCSPSGLKRAPHTSNILRCWSPAPLCKNAQRCRRSDWSRESLIQWWSTTRQWMAGPAPPGKQVCQRRSGPAELSTT